ncbi:MAG: polysaccharide biosynthesis protein [Ruminococcaceae bacterium]|nr:polysaccharide biosynthesis protein [Oscillospiraceae bacterium]
MFLKNRYLLLLDVLSIFMACAVTYFAIFTEVVFPVETVLVVGCLYSAIVFLVNRAFGNYAVAWQYSGTSELIKLLLLNFLSGVLLLLSIEGLVFCLPNLDNLRRANIVIIMMTTLCMVLYRLFFKEIYMSRKGHPRNNLSGSEKSKRVLIVGAGDAARLIIADTAQQNNDYKIVGMVDDNPAKVGKMLFGYKVLGTREDIVHVCQQLQVDIIIMAIPSAYAEDRQNILTLCNQTKCQIKTIPSLFELMRNPEQKKLIREVKIEDLLEREPVLLDNKEINQLVNGKTVMVTGGGGSIGSELCRQIMRFSPAKLVIVDIYENNAYDIQMELNELYPYNKPVVLIASIRDKERLEEIFEEYHPQIVFHAAAHKHVPLMETSPREAVKNNVFGTYNLAKTADKFQVEKFVMISTDKAVNPTNVMGATKRICEMIIQCMETISETDFVAVRFGNVLGSNGSVVPLFKKQIEKGGPVRVTHEEVTRFFMTIPEAAQLVIQAACYAKGGEIFVLDMGKPVKIYNLAENLIRLSGHTPNDDIKIEIIGLRPGEKLYEELLMDCEGLEKTANSKIFIGRPQSLSAEEMEIKLDMLRSVVETSDDEMLRSLLEQIVPTYIKDNEKFNRESLAEKGQTERVC